MDFDPDLLTVETRHGFVGGDHKRGTYRYKGIPFAAPPVGALRFRPPAPVESWTGVRVATGKFPEAPQPVGGVDAMLGATGGPPQIEAECLTLNVWTPAPDGARRPVLFWIHGGAFVNGRGLTPWYDGSNLAVRDTVVVTCNYRLGALGFLHLADLGGEAYAGSGNVGLLDQAAALRWVQENIEAFGGDPDNVTIFGESAGGMSVATQLALPASRGTFHRAIAESGAASNVHDRDHATKVARRLLDLVGLDTDDLEPLRSMPAQTLVDAQEKVSNEFGIIGGLPFEPVVDHDTLPVHPVEAVRRGAAQGINVMTGTNRDEMRLFTAMFEGLDALDHEGLVRRVKWLVRSDPEGLVQVYRDAAPEATPRALYESIGTDAVFRMPAITLAEAQSAHGAVWLYEFHRESTAFGGTLGAAHAVEIPYAFDNLGAPGANFFTGETTEAMQTLSTQMADAWVAFARTGDPNGSSLPPWGRYSPDERTTMVLDLESHVAVDPASPFREAWAARH